MHTDTDPQKATTASVSSARSVVYRDLDASSSEELAAVRHLLDEVSKADGVPAYGEAFLRALDSESADSVGYVHMVAVEGDELLGVVSMKLLLPLRDRGPPRPPASRDRFRTAAHPRPQSRR